MQDSVAERNLGIGIPSSPPNTDPIDLTVLSTDYSYYGDIMDNISNALNGFDWTIDLDKNADGSYSKHLRIGKPTIGVDPNSPDLIVFEYPGGILNYYQSESMADAGTDVFLLGSGEGSGMPIAMREQTSMLSIEGWPRWDIDVSYKDITDQTLLNNLADQEAINRKPPMPTYTVTVKGDQDPQFGSYNIGDACQLVITDPRNPSIDGSAAGLSVPSVVLGYTINPTSSQGVEEINLVLPGDTQNG